VLAMTVKFRCSPGLDYSLESGDDGDDYCIAMSADQATAGRNASRIVPSTRVRMSERTYANLRNQILFFSARINSRRDARLYFYLWTSSIMMPCGPRTKASLSSGLRVSGPMAISAPLARSSSTAASTSSTVNPICSRP
jgi:hypothetical protein